MKYIAAILLFFGFIFTLHAQGDAVTDSAISNIAYQLLVFPQEKIYMQTDKPYYITGEKIFFRAFLLDAFSNRQDTLSRYVYVELINPADSVKQRVKIRRDSMGLFYGAIPLREDLPQGSYKIRAYTQYMQNQGESSFFSKQVRIGDPGMLKEKTDNLQNIEQPKGDFDVSFYPEGGQLIAGQTSNVAFKAVDTHGVSLNITGEVKDSEGNVVAQFKTVHDGMGEFYLKPLPNEHYHAVVHVKGKGYKVKEIKLPEVQNNAIALKAMIRNDKLLISINKPDSVAYPDLYLLIHSRGNIVYAKAWDASKDFVVINTSIFPSGVNHILLLTKDLQVISERLVFMLNDDNGTAAFYTQKNSYQKREKIQAEIQLKAGNKQPLTGNFSIAVTNDKEVVIDTTSSILSGILLCSELRGQIDNPEYYFQKENKEAEQAADLLMRTHGWTRYAMPDVIRGKMTYPQILFEQSQEISGSVKSGLVLKNAKNFKVSLLALNQHFFDLSETDKNGHYAFRNFEFPDSTSYMIQALNKGGGGGVITNLYVVEDNFPKISIPWVYSKVKEEKAESVFMDYVAKADRQYTYVHGMRIIQLPEVQVKGRQINKNFSQNIYYYSAEDLKRLNVPGIIRIINHISAGLIYKINAIFIDNMQIFPNPIDPYESALDCLNTIYIGDIKNLIISGSSVIIYTGPRSTDNIKPITPLGYQLPVEFYSPKYDTQEKIDDSKPDLRTTIYWKPNVITDKTGNAKLDFYTADDPGTYSVIIEGVSEDGKLIHYRGRGVIKSE